MLRRRILLSHESPSPYSVAENCQGFLPCKRTCDDQRVRSQNGLPRRIREDDCAGECANGRSASEDWRQTSPCIEASLGLKVNQRIATLCLCGENRHRDFGGCDSGKTNGKRTPKFIEPGWGNASSSDIEERHSLFVQHPAENRDHICGCCRCRHANQDKTIG